MTSRASLYAHAIRNTVGRQFGLASAYTAGQIAAAAAMHGVFAARGWDAETCAAPIGCSEGEASLLFPAPKGDHGEARGGYQWHGVRRGLIKVNTGIDVWTASAEDTARAFIAEISEQWPGGNPYRHIEAALIAAVGIEAKMQVLLAKFEQSGNQTRDLARRVPMAVYWANYFAAKAPVA